MKFSVIEILKKDESISNKAKEISEELDDKLSKLPSKNKIKVDITVFTLLLAGDLPNVEIEKEVIKLDNGEFFAATYNDICMVVSHYIRLGDILIL